MGGVEAPVVAPSDQSANRESKDAEQNGADDAGAELQGEDARTQSARVALLWEHPLETFRRQTLLD